MILLERTDLSGQPGDQLPALIFGLVFVVHEVPELVHFSVEGFEDRVGSEELLQSRSLNGSCGRPTALKGIVTLQAYIQVKKHRALEGSSASFPHSLMKSPYSPLSSASADLAHAPSITLQCPIQNRPSWLSSAVPRRSSRRRA